MDGADSVGTPPTLSGQVRLLWRSRELLLQWARREIRAQYSQTAAGIAWAVLQPLFLVGVLAVVFGRLVRVPSEGLPPSLFYFAAALPWTFFQTVLVQGVPSLQKQMHLLSKVYFPREVIPLALLLARLVDFLLALAVFSLLAAFYGVAPTPALAWFPVLLAVLVAFAAGTTLLLGAVNVFVRDLGIALPILAQLWLYASPVIYPLDMVPPAWRPLYVLNPMASLVDGFRRVLLHGAAPEPTGLASAAAVSGVLLVASFAYFKRLEPRMPDVI